MDTTFDFVATVYEAGDRVRQKFADIVSRRDGVAGAQLLDAITRSCLMPPDTATFYHLARTLGRRGVDGMSLRKLRLNESCSVFFVVDGAEVIEVVTFRGLRQIRKLWEHTSKQKFGGQDEKNRAREAYKFANGAKRVGGGLMSQNSGPRDKWNH